VSGKLLPGYSAAFFAVLLTALYPAVTRLSITTTLAPADLLFLRLGVAGIILSSYLIWKAKFIRRDVWVAGLYLSFFHGWGMAGCVIFGLQFAPASHSAALGPGVISAWIAGANFLFYGVKVSPQKLIAILAIVLGVLLLLVGSFGRDVTTLLGDTMFLSASALGAIYLVYIQHRQLNALLGAALVTTYSAAIILPWYLLFAKSALATAPISEIAFQAFFQGILMGCCVFSAINYATLKIGSQAVGVLFALVPVLGLLSSIAITDDPVMREEWLAIVIISVGVFIGARPITSRARIQMADSDRYHS
jgi:drug/metabolite transporter (DMT)-like permease